MSSDKVRDLGCEPDEYHDNRYEDEPVCTCTYGSYAKYAGGTGFDVAKYDPKCPRHFACNPCECGGHPDCPDCNPPQENDDARG